VSTLEEHREAAAGERTADSAVPAETEVLIIGGGPVGSALATDLRLRGVRCLIVERTVGVSYDMRAFNNDMRTMEWFRRWGVADRHRAHSLVPPEFRHDLVFCTALRGHELGVYRAYGFRPEDARHLATEPAQPLSQMFTNRVLRARARELGAHVAEGWEYRSFTETPGGITAEIAPAEGDGEQRAVRARYIVGCDGGRSQVRKDAGIERRGQGGLGKHLHVVGRTPDLLRDLPISPGCFYIVFNRAVGGLVMPYSEDTFNFHLAGFEPDEDVSHIDLVAKAQGLLGAAADVEITYVAPYIVHQLIAERYRDGRALIAGDAAHLFCPFGGFNMNTGISDVGNLGWKLAARLQGWGGEALLDSYSDERQPMAVRNANEATVNLERLVGAVGEVMTTGIPEGDSPEDEAERRRLGEYLHDKTYQEWHTEGVSLDQRYTDSPVIIDDGSTPPPWQVTTYQPFAKPGHRAPHVWLSAAVALHDRFGVGFALLDLGAPAADVDALAGAAAARGVPLEVLHLDDARVRELYDAALVLVRPDQHVAWRGGSAPDDPAAVIDTVCGLGRSAGETGTSSAAAVSARA
jgi:2-polyprenyl-6-methoxyphenol hydroxylase-like FAD-dependent oxidoreductase